MYRDSSNGVIAGVLAGIARAIGIHGGWLRVIFLICFFGIGGITLGIGAGAMSFIYLLLWIFVPSR
jgi:phage shock protein PspC (stress-responsive transcriptional regulator)